MNPQVLAQQSNWKDVQDLSETPVVPVFTRRETGEYIALTVVWLLFTAYFWLWWLRAENFGNSVLYIGVSISLLYLFTLLPGFFIIYLGCMRRPLPASPADVPNGRIGRVAVVTLTVPGSESLDHVRRQLTAMTRITYPHENWILVDKEHSPIIQDMARELGVSYFCRHDAEFWGVERVRYWNQSGPPFKEKTKAGNVNAWLDAFGDDYTHFTQLDVDHNPAPEYLDRTLGYFRNAKVAWVQAPSVYGNYHQWSARGACEQELVLQGPLQMGFFGLSRTPFIIGSHCTYDMSAIRRIGGFQPTRAEDHLDTVVLAAHGYEGVFVPEVIAVGDGPETFQTYRAQQFAWAFSMIQVLINYTPRLIRKYTLRQALQFLFVQSWYPSWSLTTLFMFMAPLISLATNAPISQVRFVDFFLHSLPAALGATVIWFWSRRWQMPPGVRLSWRGIVLQMARWVTVLSAFVQVLFRVKKPYMITTKGVAGTGRSVPAFQVADLVPYAVLAALSVLMCWFYMAGVGEGPNQGMMFFALYGALLFWLVIATVLHQDFVTLRSTGMVHSRWLRHRLPSLTLVTSLLVFLLVTVAAASELIWQAMMG